MPKVLILGATGYVGFGLAQVLLRSGNYRVYGLARTPEKAKLLTKAEIIPVLGGTTDTAAYLSLLESEHIDIVVDVVGASHSESTQMLSDLRSIGSSRLASYNNHNVRGPKLGFIYCSGMWTHGSSDTHVDDLLPIGIPTAASQPPRFVAWRPAHEQAVLAASDVLDTMVVRPSLIYGRENAVWSQYFGNIYEAAKAGKTDTLQIPLEPNARPGLIHIDDVVSVFHAAVDKLHFIAGTGVYPVFDAVTTWERMDDILKAAARALGFEGQTELVGPKSDDLFSEAMSTSVWGDASRARTLLGWEPKRLSGMELSMEVCARAWVASHDAEAAK
ncbi:MAG: hypothetical protein M1836_004229 [Candelina mexicana]|nr:MAG: hypothetical protein M1836_004229 [Candelina mexicana]